MAEGNHEKITEMIKELSSEVDMSSKDISVILAGGHGKRIKSETPKMLHKIWGVPTVLRVVNTVSEGLNNENKIIVVGIKGDEVAREIGKSKNTAFVYQKEQKGTGHALQVAFESFKGKQFNGNIYVFPADMGLVTAQAVRKFKEEFERSNFDMMVLTGIYDGNPEDNYYGRVIRIPGEDPAGQEIGEKIGRVMEIKEHKDILSLESDYTVDFGACTYKFTRDQLLNIMEFNGGVYAFKGDKLREHIMEIDTDNVQGEFYLTTLVTIFNRYGLTVGASTVEDNSVIIAFNNRAVLKDMEDIARNRIYKKLKNIITFEDKEDFFLADEVVQGILELDRREETLDIVIEKGVHLHKGVRLNRGVHIKKNSALKGNIELGRNVTIWEGVSLSTYPHQTMRIGQGSEILQGNIIKGNLRIGENCRIESSVNITGSDDCPTRIGKNVTIKGTSYIFGSVIDDDVWIEHSVIKNKRVEKVLRRDGSIQKIRYYLPQPEGIDSITDLS
ncbi:NTP transferase domain-containing protein [candidate division NPL-UPA2 bacterium]|nr:NTP transferase domain-containing protein [candidate division NPL-UPA2 bacterium]